MCIIYEDIIRLDNKLNFIFFLISIVSSQKTAID